MFREGFRRFAGRKTAPRADRVIFRSRPCPDRRCGYSLSHFFRSGDTSSLISGWSEILFGDQVHAGIDHALDLLALEVRVHALDAEVAHHERVLDDEPIDRAGLDRVEQLVRHVEPDELHLAGERHLCSASNMPSVVASATQKMPSMPPCVALVAASKFSDAW